MNRASTNSSSSSEAPPVDYALFYAGISWQVFPVHSVIAGGKCSCGKSVCDSPGKHPITTNGLKAATDDKDQIRSWWKAHPEANIGVATGSASGIWVLDIDLRSDGLKEFAKFAADRALETTEQVTGSGGRHLIFVWDESAGEVRNRTNVLPGVDVRGEDGYIIVPPGSHLSGTPYAWDEGRDPSALPPSLAPDWVLDLVLSKTSGLAVPAAPNGALNPALVLGSLPANEVRSIRSALGAISPDCDHETWFRVGMALESTGAGEQAFAMWDEWSAGATRTRGSARGPVYPGTSALRRRWLSFGRRQDEEVRISSLFWLAQEAGWQGTAEEDAKGRIEAQLPPPASAPVQHDTALEKGWPPPPAEEALHGLAGDFVRMVEPHSEADPVALLAQFHVAFGNCVGRRPYFQCEADRHHSNIYLVLVGPTAKGRKGTSFGQVRAPFHEVADLWLKSCQVSGLSSGEGLIWAVRDPIEKQEPIREGGKKTGKVVDYQTVITDKGVEDKRSFVYESEFAQCLRVLGREGNTLSAVTRNAWDTGNLRILTKNSPALATDAHVSIVGHITREEAIRYLDRTEAANGFGNRFLWLCVRRSKVLPEGGSLSEEEISSFAMRLQEVLERAAKVDEMVRDPAARELWAAVYPDLSEGRPGLLGAVTARAEAQVLRLSMLYALEDGSSVIREEHLRAALALWVPAEDSAAYVFGSSLGDPVADEILRALRAAPEGLTRTEIRDLFGRNRGKDEIGRALGVLLETGHARFEREKKDGPGRPGERWSTGDGEGRERTSGIQSYRSFLSYPRLDERRADPDREVGADEYGSTAGPPTQETPGRGVVEPESGEGIRSSGSFLSYSGPLDETAAHGPCRAEGAATKTTESPRRGTADSGGAPDPRTEHIERGSEHGRAADAELGATHFARSTTETTKTTEFGPTPPEPEPSATDGATTKTTDSSPPPSSGRGAGSPDEGVDDQIVEPPQSGVGSQDEEEAEWSA